MGFVLNDDWKVGSRVIDNVPSADELRIVSLRLLLQGMGGGEQYELPSLFSPVGALHRKRRAQHFLQSS
jgi:hypothetical protein